jgi:hypothetical protein
VHGVDDNPGPMPDTTRPNKFSFNKLNCCWWSYDYTSTLCLTLVDDFQDVWMMKMLANWQAKVGEYLDRCCQIQTIFSPMQCHLQMVDQEYACFIALYQGRYQPSVPLIAATFAHFWLNNNCSYSTMDISGGRTDLENDCYCQQFVYVIIGSRHAQPRSPVGTLHGQKSFHQV